MMTIQDIRSQMPDYAKDIKLNLGTVLTEQGSPDLKQNQVFAIALACAYASGSKVLADAILEDANGVLAQNEIDASKAAASIMAMNNIYYRFVHLVEDADYGKMPASLRMNIIANSGVSKVDFELYCLAVSAINGCGMCMKAHANTITRSGLSKKAVQSAIRLAAVIKATSQALAIG